MANTREKILKTAPKKPINDRQINAQLEAAYSIGCAGAGALGVSVGANNHSGTAIGAAMITGSLLAKSIATRRWKMSRVAEKLKARSARVASGV